MIVFDTWAVGRLLNSGAVLSSVMTKDPQVIAAPPRHPSSWVVVALFSIMACVSFGFFISVDNDSENTLQVCLLFAAYGALNLGAAGLQMRLRYLAQESETVMASLVRIAVTSFLISVVAVFFSFVLSFAVFVPLVVGQVIYVNRDPSFPLLELVTPPLCMAVWFVVPAIVHWVTWPRLDDYWRR